MVLNSFKVVMRAGLSFAEDKNSRNEAFRMHAAGFCEVTLGWRCGNKAIEDLLFGKEAQSQETCRTCAAVGVRERKGETNRHTRVSLLNLKH